MKIKILLVYLISLIFCKENKNLSSDTIFIIFSEEEIKVFGDNDGVKILGSKVTIDKPGNYVLQGSKLEANIVVKSSLVNLFLQNLELSSTKTAPITIDDNLKNITITNIQNSILNDWEDPLTTEGECAVVKIKKKSQVTFENQGEFTMNGLC